MDGDFDEKYDYEKYIWQIQFRPWYIVPEDYTYNTTIDYINRLLTIRKTIRNTHMVNEQIYEIDDEDYKELLTFSEIEKMQKFENVPEEELRKRDRGYRDGWRLKYSYFTHGVPPRTDGSLGQLYEGNPLEDIVEWIRKNFPDADIHI